MDGWGRQVWILSEKRNFRCHHRILRLLLLLLLLLSRMKLLLLLLDQLHLFNVLLVRESFLELLLLEN